MVNSPVLLAQCKGKRNLGIGQWEGPQWPVFHKEGCQHKEVCQIGFLLVAVILAWCGSAVTILRFMCLAFDESEKRGYTNAVGS